MNNLISLLQLYEEVDQEADSKKKSSKYDYGATSTLLENQSSYSPALAIGVSFTGVPITSTSTIISPVEVSQPLIPTSTSSEVNQPLHMKTKGVKKGTKRGPYKKKKDPGTRSRAVLKEMKKQEKIELSGAALAILQSHIVEIHPSTSMLAYLLENLMHWNRDFKYRLGPFKTWIKTQSHGSVKFHELGGPGKDLVSYRSSDSSAQNQTTSTGAKPIHDYSLDELRLHYSGLS